FDRQPLPQHLVRRVLVIVVPVNPADGLDARRVVRRARPAYLVVDLLRVDRLSGKVAVDPGQVLAGVGHRVAAAVAAVLGRRLPRHVDADVVARPAVLPAWGALADVGQDAGGRVEADL